MIREGSALWEYLTPTKRILAGDGNFLLADAPQHKNQEPTDYSYLVFPFAKLYEGFLKQLFYNLGIIDHATYKGEFYRIGKALSPGFASRLGMRSAYRQLTKRFGTPVADRLWDAWKNGRNIVFHYFPDNYQALTLEEAKQRIELLVDAMEFALSQTGVNSQSKV